MKIEINPKALTDYAKNVIIGEPTITISPKSIVFNVPAQKLLAIHQGSTFIFELEDQHLYYKESSSEGAFVVTYAKPKMLVRCPGITAFLLKGCQYPFVPGSYTLSSFSEGRRKLIPKAKIQTVPVVTKADPAKPPRKKREPKTP